MEVKTIRSTDFINKYEDSIIAKNETNDCVVKAIASTFELEYDIAHKFVKDKFGRKNRKETQKTAIILDLLGDILGTKYSIIPKEEIEYDGAINFKGRKYNKNWTGLGLKPPKTKITTKLFLEKYPKGKYFVLVRGHAFSIIDGVVVGNLNDGTRLRAKIKYAIKNEGPC
jgi:hypothetical protein